MSIWIPSADSVGFAKDPVATFPNLTPRPADPYAEDRRRPRKLASSPKVQPRHSTDERATGLRGFPGPLPPEEMTHQPASIPSRAKATGLPGSVGIFASVTNRWQSRHKGGKYEDASLDVVVATTFNHRAGGMPDDGRPQPAPRVATCRAGAWCWRTGAGRDPTSDSSRSRRWHGQPDVSRSRRRWRGLR